MKYIITIIYLIFPIASQASLNDCLIDIFDVGQGNCTLIRYNNEAIMIDAGSNELAHSAYYNYKYDVDEQRYFLTTTQQNSVDTDSETSPSSEPALTEVKESQFEYSQDAYKNSVIDSIRAKIPQMHLKTLIVSHGDKDHNDWLPKIYTDNFTIETAIFGGFYEDYMEGVQKWIKNNKSKISFVIFTGMYDGFASKAKRKLDRQERICQTLL